jgi:adenylate kinase family enzyme
MNHRNINLLILIYFSLSILLLIPGCSKKNVIDEDKFVKIYADLVIQQDTLKNLSVKNDSLKQIVFKRYNVSEKEYKKTIDYYNNDPRKWEKFFKRVKGYLEKLNKKNAK